MKKLIKLATVCVCFLLGGCLLAACGEESSEEKKPLLGTPENLNVLIDQNKDDTTSWELSWDKVEHAKAYEVYVDGEQYKTTKTTFELDDHVRVGGSYTFKVAATAYDGEYGDSEKASVHCKIEKATNRLIYTRLEDGTYEVSAREIPKYYVTGRVVFPDKYKGVKITSIAEKCMDRGLEGGTQNLGLNSVTTEVRLPIFTTVIGLSSFSRCKALKEINIPNNVVDIQLNAFMGCDSLEKITIPESVTYIGMNAFGLTPWLASQTDDFVYINDILYCYQGSAEELKAEDFRSDISMIVSYAFAFNETLKSIELPARATLPNLHPQNNCCTL